MKTEELQFRAVFAEHERERVSAFWREQFRDSAPHLAHRPNESVWHAHSLVFAGFHGDEVIAACRLSPHHPVLGWEAGEDIPVHHLDALDPQRSVQLNRVAVRRDLRNWRLHERMFHGVSEHIVAHTGYSAFFSIVREPLVRLYRQWAIRPIHEGAIVVPTRGHQKYVIVLGDVLVTRQRLAETVETESLSLSLSTEQA